MSAPLESGMPDGIKITKRKESMLLADYSYIKSHKAYMEVFYNDVFPRLMKELQDVRDNPRAIILVTHGFLEMMVDILVKEKCRKQSKILSSSQTFSHAVKLIILNEIGAIDDESYIIYNKFRNLRNKVAHEPLFDFMNMNISFEKSNKPLLAKDLLSFCQTIIVLLWNKHIEVFSPILTTAAMDVVNLHKHPYEAGLRNKFRKQM